MNQFIKDQILEMEKHKWIESEKCNFDLMDIAFLDWIAKYAKIFREEWEIKHGKINEVIDGNSDNES